MQDSTALDTLKSLTPQNLTKLLITAERGGLITVNENGVWVSPGCKHVLHVCRGSLLGKCQQGLILDKEILKKLSCWEKVIYSLWMWMKYLPTYLPTYLPYPTHLHVPTYLPTYLPTCLPAYLPACLPACLPTYLPACLPAYLPTYLPMLNLLLL